MIYGVFGQVDGNAVFQPQCDSAKLSNRPVSAQALGLNKAQTSEREAFRIVGRATSETLLWLGKYRLRITQIRETDTPPLVVVTLRIAPPAPKAVEMRRAG